MKKSHHAKQSRAVTSSQSSPHERLDDTVKKHLATVFRKPCAAHNIHAFEQANSWLAEQNMPLILDSFCGVGESSWHLAGRYPDCAIIGVDKSAARLAKHPCDRALRANYLLVRADVDDFWRLAVAAGWQARQHYLLYPNPWPKSNQLKLRVHGSPVFPALLALGGNIELRSNWQLYVEEFALALRISGGDATVDRFVPDSPLTPFERKYHGAGQALWRCTGSIVHNPAQ